MAGGKSFWRCKICNDIHYGKAGPELCPTCKAMNAYVATGDDEAKKMMGF